MRRKEFDGAHGELPCCDRRELLRGLGVAGVGLLLGRCSSSSTQAPDHLDRGAAVVDGGVGAPDKGAPLLDASFAGSDGGLPPLDLTAPKVTQSATFALG